MPTLLPGNTRTLYVGEQSAKGTAQATPTLKLRVTDCSLDPNRTLITLPETDATSQEPGQVVVGAQPGGQFTKWLRPSEDELLIEALLGTDAGAGVYTPSVTTPWLTIYEVIPGVLCTRYTDCRVVAATYSGGAGQGISAQYTIAALSALAGQSEPGSPANYASDRALVYPDVTVTRGGTHAGDVDAFTLTVDRGGAYFFGDNGLSPVDRPNGLFAVNGSLTLAFQNDQEYRAFNTGSTAGTSLTTSIYEQALQILVDNASASLSVLFDMDSIQYTSFPVGLNTDGSPITVAAAFRTEPQATMAGNLTVTVEA